MNKKQINISKIPNSRKFYRISNLKKERIYTNQYVYNPESQRTLQFSYKTSNAINVVTMFSMFNLKKKRE